MSLLSQLFPHNTNGEQKLAIIGGRLEDDNRSVFRQMRQLSGGRILVFPTASSEPLEVGAETRLAFETHGFTVEVAPIHSENAAQAAHDPALVQMIHDFGSVYFTGGDQAKIFSALIQDGVETPALRAIRDILSKGGLLAGSSAGAAMMSETMILGGTSFEAMAYGVTNTPNAPGILIGQGLGFFPHGLVDQHFIKRGRLARLVVAMAHAGKTRGFGVDENTALIVDGSIGRVFGEYGVFFLDMQNATIDFDAHCYDNIRLSYLDDGDSIDLRTFMPKPGESKRRVKKSEIAYRAPAKSQRNAFGAYAIYDLVARLVLGENNAYGSDELHSIDPKSGVSASVEVRRIKSRSRALISTPEAGLRMSAVNFSASLRSQKLTPEEISARDATGVRTLGMDLNERSRIILLGSSPLYYQVAEQKELLSLMESPIGVFAAASSEARRTAHEHIDLFKRFGLEAVDLGVTIDTVDYAAKDPEVLDRIASMKTIFLCGGNQIRLVETLLHRGEESAVLQAIASAYAHGAALIASSGAASALSGVMISGGTSSDALRYGVASDMGHYGLVIQQGVGLFAPGIIDQNLISARRLGRLVVACVEENERFGFGICEESAIIASRSGQELKAAGRYGFVQVETDPVKHAPLGDRFIAKDVKLRMFGPGDVINLHSGHIERGAALAEAAKAFERILGDLSREGVDFDLAEKTGRDPGARHAVKLRVRRVDELSAILDLEVAREEHD